MSTPTPRCLVIPAIKKNAVIPDQLVKRLAGTTLIQRALDTAKQVEKGKDIWVVTDSDEIRLICDRNGVNTIYNPTFTIASLNIVASLRGVLDAVILGGEADLVTGLDYEAQAFATSASTEDMREGTRAFLERRAPEFRNC